MDPKLQNEDNQNNNPLKAEQQIKQKKKNKSPLIRKANNNEVMKNSEESKGNEIRNNRIDNFESTIPLNSNESNLKQSNMQLMRNTNNNNNNNKTSNQHLMPALNSNRQQGGLNQTNQLNQGQQVNQLNSPLQLTPPPNRQMLKQKNPEMKRNHSNEIHQFDQINVEKQPNRPLQHQPVQPNLSDQQNNNNTETFKQPIQPNVNKQPNQQHMTSNQSTTQNQMNTNQQDPAMQTNHPNEINQANQMTFQKQPNRPIQQIQANQGGNANIKDQLNKDSQPLQQNNINKATNQMNFIKASTINNQLNQQQNLSKPQQLNQNSNQIAQPTQLSKINQVNPLNQSSQNRPPNQELNQQTQSPLPNQRTDPQVQLQQPQMNQPNKQNQKGSQMKQEQMPSHQQSQISHLTNQLHISKDPNQISQEIPDNSVKQLNPQSNPNLVQPNPIRMRGQQSPMNPENMQFSNDGQQPQRNKVAQQGKKENELCKLNLNNNADEITFNEREIDLRNNPPVNNQNAVVVSNRQSSNNQMNENNNNQSPNTMQINQNQLREQGSKRKHQLSNLDVPLHQVTNNKQQQQLQKKREVGDSIESDVVQDDILNKVKKKRKKKKKLSLNENNNQNNKLIEQNHEVNNKHKADSGGLKANQQFNPIQVLGDGSNNQNQKNNEDLKINERPHNNDNMNMNELQRENRHTNNNNNSNSSNIPNSNQNRSNVSLITIPIQQPIKSLKPMMSPVIELDEAIDDKANNNKQSALKKEADNNLEITNKDGSTKLGSPQPQPNNQNQQNKLLQPQSQLSKSQDILLRVQFESNEQMTNNPVVKLQVQPRPNLRPTITPKQQMSDRMKLQLGSLSQERPISHFDPISNQQQQQLYSNHKEIQMMKLKTNLNNNANSLIQNQFNTNQNTNEYIEYEAKRENPLAESNDIRNANAQNIHSNNAHSLQGNSLNQVIQNKLAKIQKQQLIKSDSNQKLMSNPIDNSNNQGEIIITSRLQQHKGNNNNQLQSIIEGNNLKMKSINQKSYANNILGTPNVIMNINQVLASNQQSNPISQTFMPANNQLKSQMFMKQNQQQNSSQVNQQALNYSNIIELPYQRQNDHLNIAQIKKRINQSIPNPNQPTFQRPELQIQKQLPQLSQVLSPQQSENPQRNVISSNNNHQQVCLNRDGTRENIELRTSDNIGVKDSINDQQPRIINKNQHNIKNNDPLYQRYMQMNPQNQQSTNRNRNQPNYIQVQTRLSILFKPKGSFSSKPKDEFKPKPPEIIRDNNNNIIPYEQYQKETERSSQQKQQQRNLYQSHQRQLQQLQRQQPPRLIKMYTHLSLIKSLRVSFLGYNSKLKNEAEQMHKELKNLIVLVNSLTVDNVTQRIKLENLSKNVNKKLDKMKMNQLIQKIIKENKTKAITSRSMNHILDIKEKEIENTRSLINILTKDKAKLNTISSYPNIKLLKVQSKGYLSQIENLTIQIKELKHEKEEHAKCSKLQSELDKSLRYSQEDLKQRDVLNEQLVHKINEMELRLQKINTYREVKKSLGKPIDMYMIQPRENKSVDEMQIITFPKAMALFTEKENFALIKAFADNKGDYNKLMKTISISESLNKSMEIQHRLKLKGLEGKLDDLMKRKENEIKNAAEIESTNMRAITNINDHKADKRVYIKKINEFSLKLVSIDNDISEKEKEIKSISSELDAVRAIIRNSQCLNRSMNVSPMEEDKSNDNK